MPWSSLICRLLSLLLLGVGLSSASARADETLIPLPAQPENIAWPTDEWLQGPRLNLDPLLDPVFAMQIGEGLGETHAIVVIKKGALIYERYGADIMPATRTMSWSVAKSVTHALVGRAVQTGLIASIDDPMPGAFEEGDPRGDISWRHWLQMLDGLDYAEIGVEGIQNNATQMLYGDGRFDVTDYIREQFPLAHEPGTHWTYSTASIHLIARAVQSLLPDTCVTPGENPQLCTADPRVMSDWMDRVLFDPLGIDAVEEYDAAGTFLGGSYVNMSARDYAKFGLLYLRDGIWDGKRLLPERWVDFARTIAESQNGTDYGAGFWPATETPANPETEFIAPYDAFYAGGRQGQIIWIIPSRDIVVVRTGLMQDGRENWNRLTRLAQDVGAKVDLIMSQQTASD